MRRHTYPKRTYLWCSRHSFLPPRLTAHLFSKAERPGLQRYLGSTPWFEATAGIFPAPPDGTDGGSGEAPLLFLGRNDVHQKGIDVLVKSFALAVRQGVRRRLVIAGASSGDSTPVIERLVKSLSLETEVDVIGRVDERQKWALYRAARSLIFLSRWDGPPRPIREALAVGTPVIASTGTNMSSLISEAGAGRGVELEVNEVARAMIATDDDGVVSQWKDGARQLRQELNWANVGEAYLESYQVAVKRRGIESGSFVA